MEKEIEWIPLIAPKAFAEFTPEEYYQYVQSMHVAPVRKVKAPFKWAITAKGAFTVTINKKDKSLTREEIYQLAKESGRPLTEVWNYLVHKRGVGVIEKSVQNKKVREKERQSQENIIKRKN